MNAPQDLPTRLADALQSLQDVEDLLHAVVWVESQEDPEDDDLEPRSTAAAVLRYNLTERFSAALGGLRELVAAFDPSLVERKPGGATTITPESERWLRRQLEGL